jgi:hypothetical protein
MKKEVVDGRRRTADRDGFISLDREASPQRFVTSLLAKMERSATDPVPCGVGSMKW